jgi:hypothetical protein
MCWFRKEPRRSFRLVQLLESEIESEEGSTRIFDRANSNYPVAVQKLRTRRDNLIATISQLEENG